MNTFRENLGYLGHDPGHLIKSLRILSCITFHTENDSQVGFIPIDMGVWSPYGSVLDSPCLQLHFVVGLGLDFSVMCESFELYFMGFQEC